MAARASPRLGRSAKERVLEAGRLEAQAPTSHRGDNAKARPSPRRTASPPLQYRGGTQSEFPPLLLPIRRREVFCHPAERSAAVDQSNQERSRSAAVPGGLAHDAAAWTGLEQQYTAISRDLLEAHPTGSLQNETLLAGERHCVHALRPCHAVRGKPDFIAARRPGQTLQVFPATGEDGLVAIEVDRLQPNRHPRPESGGPEKQCGRP